ncbi:hypothetical protein [Streptomyces antimicrobicus]|uniref:hypothetical protein n=1 Tax=Streptomyces antimicrobicus TaxID=2883108 RepID=UPI0021F65DFA|nr:hypothetical protein [Streptomyces antimicrobicus]
MTHPGGGNTPGAHGAGAGAHGGGELAETGGSDALGVAVPLAGGLLLGGALLYRRARSTV